MRMFPRFYRRLRDDTRGAYLVELGFVMPIFTIILLVLLDFSYRMYFAAVVEGTVHRAARRATIGTQTPAQIDTYIRDQLKNFAKGGTVTIDKTSYNQFSRVGKPEKITTDTAPVGTYNVGDCFEDLNGNGAFDASAGRTGLGGSDDIVYYKVTATFPRLVPLFAFVGFSKLETVSSNTVLRNQPYASQAVPAIKCT